MRLPLRKREDVKMKYEYNGNLLEEDRVLLVAKEIMNKYPELNFLQAQMTARLEGYISDEVTPDDKLNRLYNIMLINQNDKKLISKVYRDYTGILKSELNQIKNYKYITISNMLKDYIDGYNTRACKEDMKNGMFPMIAAIPAEKIKDRCCLEFQDVMAMKDAIKIYFGDELEPDEVYTDTDHENIYAKRDWMNT